MATGTEPLSADEEVHIRWHNAFQLWALLTTLFVGWMFLVSMFSECRAGVPAWDDSGGFPATWSWVPLGTRCDYYPGEAADTGVNPLWSFIAVALAVWLGILVANCRQAINPARRSSSAGAETAS